jgi:hypothetical protein
VREDRPMAGDKMSEVLQTAAENAEFREALLDNRETTVDSLDLSDAEKNVLKSVPRKQLQKMIDQHRELARRRGGTLTKVVIGLGAAALVAGVMMPSLGMRPGRSMERDITSCLKQIALAENSYKIDYGTYGTKQALYKTEIVSDSSEDFLRTRYRYEITVTVNEETFVVEARHQEQPDKRKIFRIGPDGKVETINPK